MATGKNVQNELRRLRAMNRHPKFLLNMLNANAGFAPPRKAVVKNTNKVSGIVFNKNGKPYVVFF